jgi:hypothetical protein
MTKPKTIYVIFVMIFVIFLLLAALMPLLPFYNEVLRLSNYNITLYFTVDGVKLPGQKMTRRSFFYRESVRP